MSGVTEGAEQLIRRLAIQLVEDKGYFALHGDDVSCQLYDIQFWLHENAHFGVTEREYLQEFPLILVCDGEFSTGGYAPSFVEDWLKGRVRDGNAMYTRESILDILNRAREIASGYENFGANGHRYRLNPPVSETFVRGVEERYGFRLPEDCFRFITEVGDGGAGPDYGIYPFAKLLQKGRDAHAKRFWDEYRNSLAHPFDPRRMRSDEVDGFAITSRETYGKNPDRYFVFEKPEPYDLCGTDGFYVPGTHGDQWDFGLVTSGERRGHVFDTDSEDAYAFVAGSFGEFYQIWLDYLSGTKRFRADVEEWRRILRRE